VFQLRRKLAPGEAGRRLIQSERNAGYRLVHDKS
jgi:DNA-binding response OmpR family regulator